MGRKLCFVPRPSHPQEINLLKAKDEAFNIVKYYCIFYSLYCRGVYSAQDSFFPLLQIFLFFFLLVFSSKEGVKLKKNSKLFILFIFYPLPHIILVFFNEDNRKMKKTYFLFFYPLSPLPLIKAYGSRQYTYEEIKRVKSLS